MYLDRILKQGDSAEAHVLMGVAKRAAGEFAEAREEFRKAVALNASLPVAHSLLGQASLSTGDRETARAAFEQELAINANDFESNLYLGLILKEDREFDAARRHIDRAMQLRPTDPGARYQLATIMLAANEPKQTLEAARSARSARRRVAGLRRSARVAGHRVLPPEAEGRRRPPAGDRGEAERRGAGPPAGPAHPGAAGVGSNDETPVPRATTVAAGLQPRVFGALRPACWPRCLCVAQQGGAAPQKKPTFETQSTVVLLDIVVRDKKGNPVRDLRPDEVKVAEDGVPRDLTAFRLVEGQVSDDRVAGPVPAGLQPDPNRQVSLVTMVFDKILDNRQLSKQAALDFIANNMQSNVWISVFTIDQRLYLRQAFTQDPYLVKQAIFAATSTTSVAAASLAGQAALEEQHAKEAKSIAEQAEAAAAGSPTGAGAPNAAAIGGANVEAQMAQVIAASLRFSDSIQRQQQGQSTLYPMLALVKAQSRLAGRKTLIYFSEGLVVPKNLEEVFKTTIGEANRANVTVYAIDARGLNSARDSEASRSQLLKAARDSQTQMAKRGAGAVTVDEVMIAENAEESLRANVQDTLGELAQSTGGFLTANTNDFKPNMQRIATDIGSYYEAAYVPGEHRVRRQVPEDHRQGHPARRHGAEPVGLLRTAARRRVGASAVRNAPAHRARRRSASARLRVPGRGAPVRHVP